MATAAAGGSNDTRACAHANPASGAPGSSSRPPDTDCTGEDPPSHRRSGSGAGTDASAERSAEFLGDSSEEGYNFLHHSSPQTARVSLA